MTNSITLQGCTSINASVILIVDDSPTNLGLLKEYLKSTGFETRIARDGESAIQKVEDEPPDLILLDVMMPGISGFETCERIKANPLVKDIPIVFMSALSDTVDKVKGLTLGAVDYITKPFQQEELLARIQLHLKLHHLNKTLLLQTAALANQNRLLNQEIEEHARAKAALQKLSETLEQRVAERTAELKAALYDLQEVQINLVQSEKMSALGQLIAGVAHEVNNPVGFIAGNLSHAERYIKDIVDHLKLYQEQLSNPGAEIEEHAEEIDLEYLLDDLPKMIASMKTGIKRIQQLSSSLRNFSRSDNTAKVKADIYEGIDSTLLILGHRLKDIEKNSPVKIIKEYGKLPLVDCYPGQLNQVFMNLIANALDSLEEYNQKRSLEEIEKNPSTITICTEVSKSGDSVIIRIKDNGMGISGDVQKRLFEPLFTTKTVGKGTGLGLSISRQIVVEKHGGKLSCVSTFGEGAEFIIDLPLETNDT